MLRSPHAKQLKLGFFGGPEIIHRNQQMVAADPDEGVRKVEKCWGEENYWGMVFAFIQSVKSPELSCKLTSTLDGFL